MRHFFWKGYSDHRKFMLIKWEKVCSSREAAGASVKNLALQNKAMGEKLAWLMYARQDLKWVKILKAKYLEAGLTSFFTTRTLPKGSCVWIFICNCWDLIIDFLSWDIGDGRQALFWEDSWGGYNKLANIEALRNVKDVTKRAWGFVSDITCSLKSLTMHCHGIGRIPTNWV